MRNLRMKEKIDAHEALDVRVVGEPLVDDHGKETGVFRLKQYEDGIDYCDGKAEKWIWSIGRNKQTGEIYASYGTQFYVWPDFECLWLR